MTRAKVVSITRGRGYRRVEPGKPDRGREFYPFVTMRTVKLGLTLTCGDVEREMEQKRMARK